MIFVVWATEMKDWVRFIVLCMSNITSAWNNVDELPSEGLRPLPEFVQRKTNHNCEGRVLDSS